MRMSILTRGLLGRAVTGRSIVVAHCYGRARWMSSSPELKLPPQINGTIGFIGLGNMGLPMAQNLLKKGRSVTVFDLSEAHRKTAAGFGAKEALSSDEVAAQSDIIITMLPRSEHVEDVYLGEKGLLQSLAKLKRPTYLIDSSSIDPNVAEKVGTAAASLGHMMVDAPVSGGVPGAVAGSLTFMVGGPEPHFRAVEPLLRMMGSKIFHCGSSGKGQAVKVCNNALMAIAMAGVAESFTLGKALGVDLHTLLDVINCSSGRCWSSDTYNPVPGLMPKTPASAGYVGGFTTNLLVKDLGVATRAAEQNGQLDLPMLQRAVKSYSEIQAAGNGDLDFSCIFKMLNKDK